MSGSNHLGGKSSNWFVVSTRIPPTEHRKLLQRYPDRGKRSQVLRALVQMHLDGKINNLEFKITETI